MSPFHWGQLSSSMYTKVWKILVLLIDCLLNRIKYFFLSEAEEFVTVCCTSYAYTGYTDGCGSGVKYRHRICNIRSACHLVDNQCPSFAHAFFFLLSEILVVPSVRLCRVIVSISTVNLDEPCTDDAVPFMLNCGVRALCAIDPRITILTLDKACCRKGRIARFIAYAMVQRLLN